MYVIIFLHFVFLKKGQGKNRGCLVICNKQPFFLVSALEIYISVTR